MASAEQDPGAEQSEAGAAVDLPPDHLRFGVHALGPAIVKGQGDGCDDGQPVQVQPADEGVQARQVRDASGLCPLAELGLVWRGLV